MYNHVGVIVVVNTDTDQSKNSFKQCNKANRYQLENRNRLLVLHPAILAGERDPQELASMREPGCKKSMEEIGKALTGNWQEEHLFILKQSVEMYDFYTRQVQTCDEEIERVYGLTRPDWETGEL